MIFNQIKELVMQFLTNPFEYGIIQFRDNFDNIIDGNTGIFIEPAAIGINLVLLAGQCYAALRCWKAMQTSDNYYY